LRRIGGGMTRLFDATRERTDEERAQRARAEVRRRAEEADRAIAEHEELDEASRNLKKQLEGSTVAVEPIHYASYRLPGSKWQIEHALVGDDYVYQMFPLKPISRDWRDVVAMMIAAMDVIFPRSIDIRYVPPDQRSFRQFYTIRVENVAKLPGWEDAVQKRALRGLSDVQAWGS
jgi:hypothetical protein